jgi:diguanylate cyclase (GGDEF)-like protein/PAS domain S-box-containing protein
VQERKEAEALLRDTSEQLELAIMGADLGRWDHDLTVEQGYCMDVRACQMLGRDTEESTIRRPWEHLIHPDDLPPARHAMQLHIQNHTSAWQAEYRARHANGHWVWLSSRGKVVQTAQNGSPQRMVGTLMDVSVRKLAEHGIEHLAFHDSLTGLPNRRLLGSRIQSALLSSVRTHQHAALLFMDLDQFKQLNDTFGHDAGDVLLQEVSNRLLQCIRAIDTVARLGGDEFVVLVQDLGPDATAAQLHASTVAHKILNSLNEPHLINGHQHTVTPSIGVTLFLGKESLPEVLLKQADIAMYHAKKTGRNTVCFYPPTHSAIAHD